MCELYHFIADMSITHIFLLLERFAKRILRNFTQKNAVNDYCTFYIIRFPLILAALPKNSASINKYGFCNTSAIKHPIS